MAFLAHYYVPPDAPLRDNLTSSGHTHQILLKAAVMTEDSLD